MLDIQVPSSKLGHTYNKEKIEIKQNFLPNKKVLVLAHTHIKQQLNSEKLSMHFSTMCF